MLPERLKERRKVAKLTQEELAKKVNTKKTTISNYETGYSTPSNEMLSDLAGVLNTSTDYLLGRTEDHSPVLLYTFNKMKKAEGVQEQSSSYDSSGRAFLGGADRYSEEELAIAEAAARAAIEAFRKGKASRDK